jgi:pimeloyl-ACP methyl ester carboxylesterase
VATFCLLHGGWHEPSCWEPLAARLRDRGHEALTPDLPLHDPSTGYEGRTRPALDELEGATGQKVVVGHSAASGYAALAAEANPGSLLVHLCPRLGQFAPPPEAPGPFRDGVPFPADRPDGTSAWDPEAAIATLYPRLPPDTARALAARLRPLAPPADEFPLSGHPDVPTVLIYAAEDELFDPEWERLMATEVLGIEPIRIPGGHFPMLEDPDALVDVLEQVVRQPRPDPGSRSP